MDKEVKKDVKRSGWADKLRWPVAGLAVAVLCGAGYFYYLVVKGIEDNRANLEKTIVDLQEENQYLKDSLEIEKRKNSDFQDQIGQIASTVGRLDQLSKTDKELLQKYSKVYFLNENYVPEDLVNIPPDYLNNPKQEAKFHTKAFPYLQEMIAAAQRDGIDLKIISAYRSFGEQSSLKSNYLVTYGSGANKFSADQGFSEHQLGTAVDFTTKDLGSNFTAFEKASAYQWLNENAYKYGFIISYPKGNSYYMFEPWHWRFVGKSLALMLHEEQKNFYDVDQRNIDNYLITIFD